MPLIHLNDAVISKNPFFSGDNYQNAFDNFVKQWKPSTTFDFIPPAIDPKDLRQMNPYANKEKFIAPASDADSIILSESNHSQQPSSIASDVVSDFSRTNSTQTIPVSEKDAQIEIPLPPSIINLLLPPDIDQGIVRQMPLLPVPMPMPQHKPTLTPEKIAYRFNKKKYDAKEINNRYGIIDTKTKDGHGYQVLTLHLPRLSTTNDLHHLCDGMVMTIQSLKKRSLKGNIQICYVTPYEYVPPGRKVTRCCVGVNPTDWHMFSSTAHT